MPTVHFVNEHLTVEVPAGRLLSDIAAEHGILICRELLGWTRIGDYSVWVQGEPGALSEPTVRERLARVSGWRRLAHQARVQGDLRVWTQQGLGSRNGGDRPIDGVPQAASDERARRRVDDEAGTALHPYGHPAAIGRGKVPEQKPASAVDAEAESKPAPTAAAKADGKRAE